MTTMLEVSARDRASGAPVVARCSCGCTCGAARRPEDRPAALERWGSSVFPSFPAASASPAEVSTVLEAVAPADVSDADVVNGVAGWQQVLGAAQAAQAVWVQELLTRSSVPGEWVADQVATVLSCTRRLAQDLVARACLVGARPALQDAWAAGVLDARKVDVILKELAYLNEDAAAVEAAVLDDAVARAGDLTAPQLGQHVRRQVLRADADAARRRRVKSQEDRCVTLTPGVDGLAWISALLPSQSAVAVFTAVDALARTTRVAGDGRTSDQRRADAFTDVFTGILERQTTPDGTPLPRRHGQAVAVNVTVAASTLLGLDEEPGWMDSFGPIDADLARSLAQDGTWRRLLTDPATGLVCEAGTVTYRPGVDVTRTVLARDVTCTFPGCRQPAVRCDLDHRIPFDPTAPAHEQTCVDNLHALCRHHHRAKTAQRWRVTYDKTTGVSAWTSWLGFTTHRHPARTLADPSFTYSPAARPPGPSHEGERPPDPRPQGERPSGPRSAGQSPPGRSAGQSPPGRSAGQSPPGRSAGQSPPGRSAGQSPPGRSAGQSPPGRSAGQSLPGRSVPDTSPQDGTPPPGDGRARSSSPVEEPPAGAIPGVPSDEAPTHRDRLSRRFDEPPPF